MHSNKKIIFLATFSLFFLFLLSGCKVKDVASNSRPVTHEVWDSLVRQHVDEDGWVDYKGFIQDSTQLKDYLQLLSNNHPNDSYWSRDERLAYWINAYNAFTVKLIVDNYPVESIKDIKNGIPFVNTVWDIKFIEIEGEKYDLNNIEHGIIRPKFNEPRIHFAVNCASYSCPRLRNEAYTAARLDEQLTDQTKVFLADERKNKISAKEAQVSKLFTWYGGDFKTNGGSIIDFINQYAPVKLNKDAQIDYMDYQWTLNEQ